MGRQLKLRHRHVSRNEVGNVFSRGFFRQPNLGVQDITLVDHEEQAAAESMHKGGIFSLEPRQHVCLGCVEGCGCVC